MKHCNETQEYLSIVFGFGFGFFATSILKGFFDMRPNKKTNVCQGVFVIQSHTIKYITCNIRGESKKEKSGFTHTDTSATSVYIHNHTLACHHYSLGKLRVKWHE